MTEQELRKLNRTELLELLLEAMRENELLKAQLAEANQKLADRTIVAAKAGSIAQAALQLNGVFEAAQHAAEQYVENVKRLADERYRHAPQQPAPQQPAACPIPPRDPYAAQRQAPRAAQAAVPGADPSPYRAPAPAVAPRVSQQPAADRRQVPRPQVEPDRRSASVSEEDPYEAAARHYARGGRP